MKRLEKLSIDFKKKCNELKAIKAELKKIFDDFNDGIAIYEAIDDGSDFIFKNFNKAAEKIEKIKKKDLIGRSVKEVFPGVTEFGLFDVFKRVYKTGKAECYPITLYKDERIYGWRENYVFKLSSGEIITIYKDLTKQKQVEEKLKINEEKYRSLFERSLDGIYESTIEGKYIDANPALTKILGYDSKEELFRIDIPTQLYASKDDRPEINKRDRVFETKLKKKDRSIIYVEISSRVVYKNDKPAFYEGMVRDITERKKIEEQLKFLSFHDKLTGLHNRAYFEEELKRLDTERQLPLSIVMADVNGLKFTNDIFGHPEGDLLLCECAKIFEKCFRREDIVARWGGDEFIILLPRTTEQEFINIINRIEVECSKSNGQKIPVSISMGGSTKTEIGKDIDAVIIEAEELMYRRKFVESKSISSSIITSLKRVLFEKDIETEEHADRTNVLALQLGKSLNLSKNELAELSLSTTLHDIGKVAIPDEILLRNGKLSKPEWKLIKKHPETGYNIARSSPHLSHIANVILTHHEWWDGSGYPQGLKGDEIPITSRILAVVDAYNEMINGRPYKSKMNINEVIKEFKRCAGTQFDPHIVKKFLSILRK
ncbi:MAG: diguanylate cyclase [Actinobacteria bacterium]|nr:diguanylate cyclase [Actinomycetota bacterium]